MSAPIPLRMLPHSISLEPFAATVGSNPTYGEPIILTHVRLEPFKQNIITALGEAKNDKMILFIDCKMSAPRGTVPVKKDRVTFGSLVLSVREVTPCYGTGPEVHHFEVALA